MLHLHPNDDASLIDANLTIDEIQTRDEKRKLRMKYEKFLAGESGEPYKETYATQAILLPNMDDGFCKKFRVLTRSNVAERMAKVREWGY